MSENLITVGTYSNAAEAEIAHSAMTEQDIPAYVEEEFAATALPGTSVKLQVPADCVRKARRVLEHVERRRLRRLASSASWEGDRLPMDALLLAAVSMFLFPALLLLQIAAIGMMGSSLDDLLAIRVAMPLFVIPALFSLTSVVLLGILQWQRHQLSEESQRSVRDAWFFNLIVLGSILASVALVGLLGRF